MTYAQKHARRRNWVKLTLKCVYAQISSLLAKYPVMKAECGILSSILVFIHYMIKDWDKSSKELKKEVSLT